MKAVVAVLISIAALVGIFFVADAITRGVIEGTVADQIEQNLPENVEGTVDASIGGFSVLAQIVTGSLDDVTLRSDDLTANGVPLAVDIHGAGVPIDFASRPVDRVEGTVTIAADAAAELIPLPAGAGGLVLGDGTVSYAGSIAIFGLSLDYSVTAEAVADGDQVLVTPTNVEIGSGGNSVDLSGVVQQISQQPIPVCVASYLPEGLEVSDITVTPSDARVTFESTTLVLDAESLQKTGSCG